MKERYKPKVGEKFNRWTFIEEVIKSNKVLWKCRCDCGTIKHINYYCVLKGSSKSCGCYHSDKMKEMNWCGYGDISGRFWNVFVNSAKKRSIEVQVDKKYLWDLFIKQGGRCALSNLLIKIDKFEKNKEQTVDDVYAASVDRINNNIGYLPENVRWVVREINLMKWKLEEKDFLFFCKRIDETNK